MPDPKSKIYRFESEQMTVTWDLKRCMHAEECVHRLPSVFDRHRRPWVDPSQATVGEVTEAVSSCPSGALRIESEGGSLGAPIAAANTIEVSSDGPLFISGEIVLTLPSGATVEDDRMALCRCGDSKNMPYCDASHVEAGFTDPGALGESKMGQAPADPGAVRVSPAPDGPLILSGSVTLHGADSEAQHGNGCALCRCGHSANKPYCDGTHKPRGFHAD